MPELPEVHTITTDLRKYCINSYIHKVKVVDGYQIHSKVDNYLEELEKKEIVGVSRLAKNIVLELSSQHFIAIHLAMTGKLLLRKEGHPVDRWERVKFKVTKNNKHFELRFCDMRMFGKVKVFNNDQMNEFKTAYGPEPLNSNITPERFLALIKSKRTNIKNVLLDQKIISGLGNVYANDALWIAQIHPETKTELFDLDMATRLLEACREILEEGIKNRGISMSDYVDLFGKKGNQQDFFRIYQKDNCSRCGTKVEFKKLNGRGTYFCPNCQIKGNVKNILI